MQKLKCRHKLQTQRTTPGYLGKKVGIPLVLCLPLTVGTKGMQDIICLKNYPSETEREVSRGQVVPKNSILIIQSP
jgi:hypothetical protein